jgi:hypothetical protein
MQKPTIHLNGTSRDSLFDSYCNAASALRNALAALEDAAPNARDYYPQGEGAFIAAAREHEDRTASLRYVLAQIDALVDHTG